jgi:sporulation-control protein
MFEKVLSSIGIGSAKVNTVLMDKKIERGQEITGEVHIFGGKTEQKISEIYIHIDSEFHKDDDHTTDFRDIIEPILEIKITNPLIVKPHEEKVIPFSFHMPYYMPVTFRNQEVTIKIEVDIKYFINHLVESHNFVVSDQMIEGILNYLTNHGFKHTFKSGLCRHRKHGDDNPTHFLQTFILTNAQETKVHFVGNQKDIHIYVNKGKEVQYYPIYREHDLMEQLNKLPI